MQSSEHSSLSTALVRSAMTIRRYKHKPISDGEFGDLHILAQPYVLIKLFIKAPYYNDFYIIIQSSLYNEHDLFPF